MARYGSDNVTVEFDNSSGTLVDISAYVTEIRPLTKRAVTVDGTTMGDAWRKPYDSTLREFDDVEITCFYDDTASTGPWVLFNDIGSPTPAAGRELKVTFGSTKSVLIPTMIAEVERILGIGELHMMRVVLKHYAGTAPTEA